MSHGAFNLHPSGVPYRHPSGVFGVGASPPGLFMSTRRSGGGYYIHVLSRLTQAQVDNYAGTPVTLGQRSETAFTNVAAVIGYADGFNILLNVADDEIRWFTGSNPGAATDYSSTFNGVTGYLVRPGDAAMIASRDDADNATPGEMYAYPRKLTAASVSSDTIEHYNTIEAAYPQGPGNLRMYANGNAWVNLETQLFDQTTGELYVLFQYETGGFVDIMAGTEVFHTYENRLVKLNASGTSIVWDALLSTGTWETTSDPFSNDYTDMDGFEFPVGMIWNSDGTKLRILMRTIHTIGTDEYTYDYGIADFTISGQSLGSVSTISDEVVPPFKLNIAAFEASGPNNSTFMTTDAAGRTAILGFIDMHDAGDQNAPANSELYDVVMVDASGSVLWKKYKEDTTYNYEATTTPVLGTNVLRFTHDRETGVVYIPANVSGSLYYIIGVDPSGNEAGVSVVQVHQPHHLMVADAADAHISYTPSS